MNDVDVVVIGGGAAGIGAALRLRAAGIDCVVLEARDRLGGRAWTVATPQGFRFDNGCGWLHSADRNPWVAIAQAQGRTIDRTMPPWGRPAPVQFVPQEEQDGVRAALDELFARLAVAGRQGRDAPTSELLPLDGRWNGVLNSISTYISGVELDRVSLIDFDRYADTGVNWRVAEGYGTTVAAHGADLPVRFETPVTRIDHRGSRLRIETPKGTLKARAAIVTLPTSILANEALFDPVLPAKVAAAQGLPLGLADKLFIAFDAAKDIELDFRVFGQTERAGTGNYHVGPFGRPVIEAYYGGQCARELERGGMAAFFDFAVSELSARMGNDIARRLAPMHVHCWGADPFAQGSYSCALPGHADDRAILAAPVDGRLFFAGEACSLADFSTAHGAYLTGMAAADAVVAARSAAA